MILLRTSFIHSTERFDRHLIHRSSNAPDIYLLNKPPTWVAFFWEDKILGC